MQIDISKIPKAYYPKLLKQIVALIEYAGYGIELGGIANGLNDELIGADIEIIDKKTRK